MKRPIALSMFPDHKPDRPTGPIPLSIQLGSNADMIAAIAPLYLTGSVLDATYGLGNWWSRFTPDPFTWHDLAKDQVDFRDLPEADRSIDAVTFDPPYIQNSSAVSIAGASAGGLDLIGRFGLTEARTVAELWDGLIAPGLAECQRVASSWVLAKCMDYANGRGLDLGHRRMLDLGDTLGMRLHDLIIYTHGAGGPGGHQINTIKRTRRAHSYLLVFEAHP